jgi:hypothetical protein
MTANDEPAATTDRSTRFDVRGFARTARGNHRATLQLAEYAERPLPADSLRLVRYLGQLESATMQHLRNVLVTATHKDARVTAFLVTWAFEKFWLADALDAVLAANGVAGLEEESSDGRRHARNEAAERRGPIRRAISAIVVGTPIVAVHMTVGLIDEWITRAAYKRLVQTSGSTALASTIDMVLDVKRRHSLFFDDEARRRLSESAKAARLTRTALHSAAWPLGAIDRSDDDRSFFEGFTFGGSEGHARAAAIGSAVATLPGIGDQVAATITARLSR